jgi:uncharacterized protein YjbI with pentapeptide repeats
MSFTHADDDRDPTETEVPALMKVLIGVDPHKASVAVAAVDEVGELIECATFPQNRAGLRALERWAKRFPGRRWAVENAGGLGRHLAGRLCAADESVVDVPPKLSARVRVLSTGNARKNDGLDALATALAASRNERLAAVDPEADLGDAVLSDASLRAVNLEYADLSHARLARADLSGAYLFWADLPSAKLRKADLSGAYLRDANLNSTYLYKADLRKAHLVGVRGQPGNLICADLRGANLEGVNLSGAALSGSDLTNADVSEKQLQQARFLNGATMPNGQQYEEWLKSKDREEDRENSGTS